MRSAAFTYAIVAIVLSTGAGATAQPTATAAADRRDTLTGTWSGEIKVPGTPLRVVVVLRDEDDALGGTIDIPQQSATGIPLENVSRQGQQVRFRIAGVPGQPSFAGKLDGSTIRGTFTQGGASFPFELTRGEPPRPNRPQDPKPPFPYALEHVAVNNGDVKLAGTLTRPSAGGPFPAVILISGSGPQNRDEEVFDHRPFAVLADHLTRGGIAVLRYDDRGVGESTGSRTEATTADFAADAEAWVAYLKSRNDVSKIGLLGHSEGGSVATMVAPRNEAVAFVIMLAGPGVDGAEILVEQNRAMAKAAGASDEQADLIADRAQDLFDAIAKGESADVLHARIKAMAEAQTGRALSGPEADNALEGQLRLLGTAWFVEFLRYDPADDLKRIQVPVLAIFGEKDVQVVASQNLPRVEQALEAGGNPDFTVKVLPDLNHLFQKARTGSPMEYADIEETMNLAVLELIRDWISSRFGTGG